MNKNLLVGIALGLVTLPAAAVDKGDPVKGEQVAAQCVACHGEGGNSGNAAFPNLAGQYADYIVKALQDYKSGARKPGSPLGASMPGMAAGLSQADMENVAAYYSRQSGQLYAPSVLK